MSGAPALQAVSSGMLGPVTVEPPRHREQSSKRSGNSITKTNVNNHTSLSDLLSNTQTSLEWFRPQHRRRGVRGGLTRPT